MADRVDVGVPELRRRLYRPNPPDGAVDAYLAALGAPEPAAAEGSPAPAARRPRRLIRIGLVAAVLAIAAVVVVTTRPAPVALRPAPAVAGRLEVPDVPGYPIGDLFGGPATTGRFDAGGSRVIVSVLCAGVGTIRLTVGDERTQELTCESTAPALAMLESATGVDRFTIAVEPSRGLRWSLAVGALALPSR